MKHVLVLTLLLSFFVSSYAQDSLSLAKDTSYWHRGASLSLNLSQTSLTNWNAGGQNAIAYSALSRNFINYEKNRLAFSNALDMAFGQANLTAKGWRKTDDRLYYVGKLSYIKSKKLRYSLFLDFLTQFANGYNYVKSTVDPGQDSAVRVSRFMSRGISNLAVGAEYTPFKGMFIFFSPVTMKATFVGHQPFANAGAFGVRPEYIDKTTGIRVAGKNTLFEPGALLDIIYKGDLAKNINLQSKASLFWSYLRKKYTIDGSGTLQYETYIFYKNLDVMWDFALVMKITKYISTSITTSLIYDDDINVLRTKYANDQSNPKAIGPSIQFKQVLGIGLQANFKSK
jgi:hypothetical protein